MPNFRIHLILGIIILGILGYLDYTYFHFLITSLDLKFFLLAIPLALIGTIAPDIDTEASKVRFLVTIGLIIAIIYYIYNFNQSIALGLAITLLLVWILPRFPGCHHREFFHSLTFLLISSGLISYFIDWKIGIVFGFGFFTHIILDREIRLI